MYKIYVHLLINGLTKVYTIIDIKHKNDRLHGIVNNKAGIFISILQLFSSNISALLLSSVIFVTFIYK